MSEYTGRTVRISGDLTGEVKVSVPFGARGPLTAATIKVPAADLLGWLRATLPLRDDDLPTTIAILKWAEQQHISHDGLVERVKALQAALSTTTTKEG